VLVPVESLLRGDSPRLSGESKSHAQLMADAPDTPPIIVHRSTMHVIDGMHRLTAAKLRHQETIAVRFFDGTVNEAFIIAVAANIAHGLPLSRKDRRSAAARILEMYPCWSDRLVASTAGLSHHTVAAIRRDMSTGQIAQSSSRLGKDGKTRPVPSKELRSAPELVPVGTVQDVRVRAGQGSRAGPAQGAGHGPKFGTELGNAALKQLSRNPAVRFNQDGRALVQLLSRSLQNVNDVRSLTGNAPEHCLDTVADVALALSDSWSHVAQELLTKAKCG
jgi:ParB-like nuclease domain